MAIVVGVGGDGHGRFGMKMLLRAKILIFVFAPLFSPALVREREFTFKLTAIHTAHTSIQMCFY